jgi:DNA repair protein RadC
MEDRLPTKTLELLPTPDDERPRERLLSHGAETLSDAELVAVLLRTGRQGLTVQELARQLLEEWGGLWGLPGAGFENLKRRGLGPAKAATLMAAVEVGRRLVQAQLPERDILSRPSTVASFLNLRFQRRQQEVMGALFLDSRHRLLSCHEFFRGTLYRASVEPRGILKEALVRSAAGIVLFHTHPSGDPSPSAEDLLFTRRMVEAGELLGVRIVDHMILGYAQSWVSLRQRGECRHESEKEDKQEPDKGNAAASTRVRKRRSRRVYNTGEDLG